MTDRRKMRRLRESRANLHFVRREVTDPREKDFIRGQMQEDVARVQEEKRNEVEHANAAKAALEDGARLEKMADWEPYQSEQDVARVLARAHPTWDLKTTIETAKGLWERYQLVRDAIVAGLKRGRDLRARRKVGLGWDWPELHSLTPTERGHVMEQVQKIVCL